MKRFLVMSLAALTLFACESKEENENPKSITATSGCDLFPLVEGNKWVYKNIETQELDSAEVLAEDSLGNGEAYFVLLGEVLNDLQGYYRCDPKGLIYVDVAYDSASTTVYKEKTVLKSTITEGDSYSVRTEYSTNAFYTTTTDIKTIHSDYKVGPYTFPLVIEIDYTISAEQGGVQSDPVTFTRWISTTAGYIKSRCAQEGYEEYNFDIVDFELN